jgi:hypothetical protein
MLIAPGDTNVGFGPIIGARFFFPVEAQGGEAAQHRHFQQGLNGEVRIRERGGKGIVRPGFRRARPYADLEVTRIGGRYLEERLRYRSIRRLAPP